MSGCSNVRRIQVMDIEDGRVLTIRDERVIGGIGDTIVISIPQGRISGTVPSIYGKYVGKLPPLRTIIRGGQKYDIKYIKAIRIK